MGRPQTERQKKQHMVRMTYAFYLGGIIALAIINPSSFIIPVLVLMVLGHLFLDPRVAFWKWGEIFGKEKFRPAYRPSNAKSSFLEYQPKG